MASRSVDWRRCVVMGVLWWIVMGRARLCVVVRVCPGLVVTLGEGVTELGGPCGCYVDVYRLGNGMYVVSGLGLGGQSDRGGLCVFGVGASGSVAVKGRASVGVSTDGLSVMVSRCRNRVCVAHKGGVSVVSVDSDGVWVSMGLMQ